MKLRRVLLLTISSLLFSACGNETKVCTHEDKNHDSICDLCGYQGLQVTHTDGNKDHACDVCGNVFTTCVDSNLDYICDICGKQLEKPIEHKAPFEGGVVHDDKYWGYEFTKKNVKKQTEGIGTVSIVGFNDYHGAINANEESGEAGLAKFGTVIKSYTDKENTLCFDQGDTWQGSLESNYAYGQAIQDVFSCANVSLRTVGNHDFDWGLSKYKEVANRKYGDYTIPSLCANIYDYNWDTKVEGNIQQYDLAKSYATFVIENGLKIGVVGVIGEDQITSICTQNVKNICFKNHITEIKNVSDYLRTTKNCDIVIASVHGSADECLGTGLTTVSEISGKRYVDLVLNAHTHQNDIQIENNVIFSQWGRNSCYIGDVTLKYDFSTHSVVSSTSDDRTSYNAKYMRTFFKNNDPEIDTIVNDYLTSIKDVAGEVLSTRFSGTFESNNELPNLMAEAINNEADSQGYKVDISVCNYARNNITSSRVTYSDLYRSFPFDNEIIIMKVKGYSAINTIRYNFSYHENVTLTLDSKKEYLIACIDYLALHTDENRSYDFFPDAVEVGKLSKKDSIMTYRDILKSKLLSDKTKIYKSSDYSTSNTHFSF